MDGATRCWYISVAGNKALNNPDMVIIKIKIKNSPDTVWGHLWPGLSLSTNEMSESLSGTRA